MGRTLTAWIIVLALGGAAYFLFTGETSDEGGGGYDEIGGPAAGEDAEGPSGPGLKSSGTANAKPQPSGPRRFAITGTVVDAEGKPVADVAVAARHYGKAQNRNDPSSYVTSAEQRFEDAAARLEKPFAQLHPITGDTRTQADGSFEIKLAEPGQFRVAARPAAPLFGTQGYASVHAEQQTESVSLHVLAGTALSGRVLDSADKPVAATLTAAWSKMEGGTHHAWAGDPVESAAGDGAFHLDAVPKGTLRFTVLLPGGRRMTGIVVETPHAGECVIRVPASGGRVAGTITDADGNGIADAVILLSTQATKAASSADSTTTSMCKAVTDSAGTYAIDDAPLGRVTSVQARADGFLTYAESTAMLAATERKIEADKPLTLDVSLSRGGTVQGRVLDKAGGAAIAGATVRLFSVGGMNRGTSGPVRTATCDANGRYAFDAVDKGRHVALPQAEGYYLPQLKPASGGGGWAMPMGMGPGRGAPAALTVVMTDEGVVVERDLELSRGFKVEGRVVDAAGTGIGGAEIHARGYGLQSIGWQWGLGGMAKEPLARSATGGRFTIDGLPPKADWVLYATKKTYAGVYGAPFAAGEDAPQAEVTLKLEAAGTVRGSVVDDAGQGVAGVQVNYWGQAQELAGSRTSIKTDAAGTFELLGVPPGDWTLNVWAQGRTGKQQQVRGLTAGETREDIVITIAAGVEVSGIVVDKDGEPISGLQLMLRPLSGMTSWNSTMTGQDGRFSFGGAKAGKSQIFTFSGGRQTPVGKPFTAPATDLRLEQERIVMVRIRGEVRGPDGELIPLCSVRVRAQSGGGLGAPSPAGFPGGMGGTDAVNGAFDVVASGTGPWTVTASAPRDAEGKPMNLMAGKAVVEDAATKAVITLERGHEIAGAVVDASGKGVADVVVGARGNRAQTNENGRFRIPGLTKGKHSIGVTPPAGFVRPQPQTAEAGTRDLRFVLEAGLKIVGKAVDPDGKALKQGWVQGTWGTAGKPQQGSVSAQIQPDGTFTLNGIPAGVAVRVTVQVWNPTGGSAMAPKVIENVRPGTEDLEVRMGAGLTIEGTVLGADGKPAGGCYVYGVSLEGNKQTGYVMVGDDGLFELSGLEPGRYRIHVMRTGGGAAPAPVEVDAPARGVRVKLPKSARLAGRVEGLPEGNDRWTITAVDADGKRLATAIIQGDGSWSIDAVREGSPVWLNVSAHMQEHYAVKGPVQPGNDSVVLRAKKGSTISGVISGGPETADGPRMYVSAEGGRGWRASAAVDKDGVFSVKGLPPGTYTLKVRTFDNKYSGEAAGVRDGAKDVRITVEAR